MKRLFKNLALIFSFRIFIKEEKKEKFSLFQDYWF
jgi:hypothetical protein